MTLYEEFEELRPCKKIIANEINIEFDSILEVGCYYGESLLAIEKKFPDKKIVGIDINTDVISEGQKYLKKAKLIYGDAKKLPFPDKSFDIVFTNALICMLDPKDVETVIKEIVRVAKKQVMFVELMGKEMTEKVSFTSISHRTVVNWNIIFEETPTIRKILLEEWEVEPWRTYGYLIKLKL